MGSLPAMRRWDNGHGAWERTAQASRIYRTSDADKQAGSAALHTVTVCDLARRDFSCQSTVVIGPEGRVFYVSPTSVYIWIAPWRTWDRERPRATVVRMPLDGSAPSSLRAAGNPVDQFSFLESRDGYLNVLVRSGAAGDAMWWPEHSGGDAALLRVPLGSFGDSSAEAPLSSYRFLSAPSGYDFHNRFVGDYLLFGVGNGWGTPRAGRSSLYALPWRGGDLTELHLSHGVDRIEVMGAGAVVVGSDEENLTLSGIALDSVPRVVQQFRLPNVSQGETRSHGFFYRQDDDSSGVIGLPVRERAAAGYRQLFETSASILFVHNVHHTFKAFGLLKANPASARDDNCVASCVDWYGNARPVFIGQRVFALLGYELVEGRIDGDQIAETGRVMFASPPALRAN